MQLLSLHIHCSGRMLPHGFTGNPPPESAEEERIKMLTRNMAKMLRRVIWLADDNGSNEDGFRDNERKFVENDTF